LLVELEDVEDFCLSFLLRGECGVALLPEELTGAEEGLWMLELPALERERFNCRSTRIIRRSTHHNVVPLI
jgi:hypothetical protein